MGVGGGGVGCESPVQVVLVSGDDQLQMVLWEELLISRATTNVVFSLLKTESGLFRCLCLCLWGSSWSQEQQLARSCRCCKRSFMAVCFSWLFALLPFLSSEDQIKKIKGGLRITWIIQPSRQSALKGGTSASPLLLYIYYNYYHSQPTWREPITQSSMKNAWVYACSNVQKFRSPTYTSNPKPMFLVFQNCRI